MGRIFSFRYKLLLSFLLISTVPLVIVSILLINESNKTLEQREITSNLNFLRQAGYSLEQLVSNVNEISLFIVQNQDSYVFLHLPENVAEDVSDYYSLRLYKTLMFFLNKKNGIKAISIDGYNGLSFSLNPSDIELNVLDNRMTEQIISLDGDALWSVSPPGSSGVPETVIQSRLIKDYRNLDRNLGIVTIHVDPGRFIENLSESRTKDGETYCVLGKNGKVLLASENPGKNIIDIFLNDLKESSYSSGYRSVTVNSEKVMLFYYSSAGSGLTIIRTIPINQIRFRKVVINQITFVTLLMVAVSILLAVFFSRSFFTPLQLLEQSMKTIEKEQFKTFIPLNRKDEIGSLLNSFNKMVKRLHELHNEVYIAHVKEKEAELTALETQINPHFLYNTLDTIYWKSKIEGAPESAEMVKSLAGLFRIVLSGGNEIIPLKNEVAHLKYYVDIQKVRFGERLDFSLDIQSGLEERKVLKLILQPLVENSIIHGLEKNKNSLSVNVGIYENNKGELVYQIKDNGPGFNSGNFEKSGGFGLKNVEDRLILAYGENYHIIINSTPGRGTVVTVRQNHPVDRRYEQQ